MRDVCVWVLGVVLASSSTVASGQRARGAESSCYKHPSHVEATRCLERHAQHAAAALDSAERTLRGAVAARDEEKSEKERELAAFDDAAARFREYRKQQCTFVASLAAGGNAALDRQLLCEIELNHARAADLTRDNPHGV